MSKLGLTRSSCFVNVSIKGVRTRGEELTFGATVDKIVVYGRAIACDDILKAKVGLGHSFHNTYGAIRLKVDEYSKLQVGWRVGNERDVLSSAELKTMESTHVTLPRSLHSRSSMTLRGLTRHPDDTDKVTSFQELNT